MTGAGGILGVTKLVDNGRPAERFNIVIVSEGYTRDEIDNAGGFHDKAQEIVKGFLSTPPFDELWNGINFYRVDVFSDQHGADDPICGTHGYGTYVNTYFDATFCTGGVYRLLDIDRAFLVSELKKVSDLPTPNLTLVIVNTTSGGSGGKNIAVFSSMPDYLENWINLVMHELGHSIANLADEYEYYGGCDTAEPYYEKYPGTEAMLADRANVTTNKDPLTIKWRKWISSKTRPLPTKSNPKCSECDESPSPVPLEIIGAFEGAHHYRCGIFRPKFECIMRSTKKNPSFCPVCREAISSVLAPYVPEPNLIVFHIDNPSGENRGFNRIGWNLDINGNIMRGWSDPIQIDGWFGDKNQGGGIAVADVDGNGQLDLIVFDIDHPSGGNRGFYRIGWNLDVNGVVTGDATGKKWSDPIQIDGWFGDKNQSGDIALFRFQLK
jgi:IgA Peptidase M64